MRAAALTLCVTLTLALSGCGWGSAYPPPGGVKVGRPYNVNGKTYKPQYRVTYREEGTASWYGPGFHGKRTASGEVFDARALTAAHPTLQMPCTIRVTNLDNGRVAELRVNDRGPFSKRRLIDVSEGAAKALGFRNAGTARVRVELLEPVSAPAARPPMTPQEVRMTSRAGGRYSQPTGVAASVTEVAALSPPPPAPPRARAQNGLFVQVGAFAAEGSARALAARLPGADVAPPSGKSRFWRVYMGPFASRTEAEAARASLARTGHGPGLVLRSL